jgi:signal transduction histidine kinase
MHQLQRLEAMGALAGGLAHDFNNALAVILGTLGLLERKLPANSELLEMVGEMKTPAVSASSLARRLLRLGAPSRSSSRPCMLDALVHRTAAMMRRQLPAIEVSVDVAPDLAIAGSQEELHQVLVNLMLNARDAMPRVARCVSTPAMSASSARKRPRITCRPKGDYIEIVVADSGVRNGRPATLAARVRAVLHDEPPAEGTGLGLAMIHSIVRRHGGSDRRRVSRRSRTTFRIWLPRAAS